MAETKTTLITNLDAQPPLLELPALNGGRVKNVRETVEAPILLAAGPDLVRLFRVHIEDFIKSLKLAFDDLGTTGVVDIGLYRISKDGGAVVDVDAFASGVDVATAAVPFTEYRYSALGIETCKQKVWELAGLSARPSYSHLDVAVTATTNTTAAGTISVDAELTQQN